MIAPVSSIAGSLAADTAAATAKRDDPKKVVDAAQQFESLLIAQVLKISREAGGSGWMGTGEDQAGAIGLEVAEQEFARLLAARGGLGLARMIAAGLQQSSSAAEGAQNITVPATPPQPYSESVPKESAG